MSLDQNLFTLQVKPSATDPTIVDLADPTGNVFYRKQRSLGPVYTAHIYDFASQSLLVTTNAPSATSKVKIIELQNPLVPVELKASGTFSVRWAFRWKEHEFEWKREECYIIRKPDPPVLVAITKEIPGRVQFATIQVLDYNLNRFDIEDRKGLELVILSGLLTFLDSADVNQNQSKENEQPVRARKISTWTALSPFGSSKLSASYSTGQPAESAASSSVVRNQDSRPRARSSLGSVQPQPSCSNSPSASRHHSTPAAALGSHSISTKSKSSPPTPPPTPPPVHPNLAHHHDPRLRKGSERTNSTRSKRVESGTDFIAQMHALRSVIHEVTVYEEGTIEDYARFCWRLLRDEAMGFITVRSVHSLQVQKVLEVVEATKRLRFQSGPYIELLQFVTYYPLPGSTTLQQRLAERARLSSMTPKEAKKVQKKKEKEVKKREAKAKKGKGKEKGNVEPNGGENALELKELQVPPKSVTVRLTKVEVQKLIPPFPTKVEQVPEERFETTNGKGKSQQLPVEDPRFLVQQAEIPIRYISRVPAFPSVPANLRTTARLRRPVTEALAKPVTHHHHSSDLRPRSSNPVPTPDGFNDLLRSSASQPTFTVTKPSPRGMATGSVSYPGASTSSHMQIPSLSIQANSLKTSPPTPSPVPPPLPPRRSQGTLKAKIDHEDTVAGPSSCPSADQAPPSYSELLMEDEFPVDLT